MNGKLHPLIKFNLILLLFFLIIGGLYLASSFLIPLTFAGILAMLMSPLCTRLEATGLHKALSSFLCILLLLLFFAAIGAVLSAEIASFTKDLPKIEEQINKQINGVQTFVQSTLGISLEQQKEAVKGGPLAWVGGLQTMAIGFLNSFTGVLSKTVLVLVYMFLLLYYRSRFPTFIMKVVSEDQKKEARRIIRESSRVAQQYLIGRGILILILAILYSIGLSIVGLDNAIFLSLLTALLSIIPYVGNIIGFALLILMALVQTGGSSLYTGIFIVFSISQFIESYILEPFIVGAEVDIHPLFTVIIIILGWQLWGVAGMILAIPIFGILKIIFSHISSLQPYAYLIGDTRNKQSSRVSEKIKAWFTGHS